MHELSIALAIVEGVEEELVHHPDARVAAVHLRLGPLSGVVTEALRFSFNIACEGTRVAGAVLEIEEMPIVLFCSSCQAPRRAESIQELCCSTCGTLTTDIRGGSELEVFAMELVDETATPLPHVANQQL